MLKLRSLCLIYILFAVFPYQSLCTYCSQSLSGNGWTVSSLMDNGSFITVPATIPTDVYMALYQDDLIPDPYTNDNDVELRYLSWQNWNFSRQFMVPDISLTKTTLLIAHGIDTVCQLYINDQPVGLTTNMFRAYVFDISSSLLGDNGNDNGNSLRLAFQSPLNYSASKSIEYKNRYGYDVPNNCTPPQQHGECHANFIRKMQSSFSWDWGPAFPTMAIYKDIQIVQLDYCTILQFSIVPLLVGSTWTLKTDFLLYCAQNVSYANFTVQSTELNLQYSWAASVTVGRNTIKYSFENSVSDGSVEKWWPNGFGTQKLYNFVGTVQCVEDSLNRSINVGFRTVEIVQDPIIGYTDGLTFYFVINKVPIFLKGSNWIPADSFLNRITTDRLNFFFMSMKEANFNALRVWGGGVFETEEFYDMADQNGIMIFQDMMFAVNLYPSDKDFLENVANEVFDQVSRLKHRPCIIVWSGNNENELGLVDGWYKMDAPFDQYKSDYLKLYNQTIYAVINDTDYYSRPFLMSSPSNGLNSTKSGGVDTNPASSLYGDVHVYRYLADGWNPTSYPIPRCATEYGFQGYPSIETLLQALSYDDLGFFNRAILHRQHHPAGQLELLEEILIHFDIYACNSKFTSFKKKKFAKDAKTLQDSCLHSKMIGQYFEEIVYLTQAHQAIAYKTETEHYRRWRSSIKNGTGEGLTMCALYWQLDDIWQAPTWASIDYGLKWKMVHYYAKRFFSPVLVSPYVEGTNLKISVVSDSMEPLNNTVLLINVHTWGKLYPVFTFNIPITSPIPPSSAVLVFEDNIPDILGPANAETVDIFFDIHLQKDYQDISPNNVLFPHSFRKITKELLGQVTVANVTTTEQNGVFLISLSASAPAPFVWLNANNVLGWFSDNGFTMLTKYMQITFNAWQNDTTLQQLTSGLTVISLGDIYRSPV